MLKTINWALLKVSKAVKRGKNILENRTCISLLTIFSTSLAIFLLTGLLYFRNEVIITDGGIVTDALTALQSPDDILAEQGFTLGADDYYIFSGFENNIAYLEIIRAPEKAMEEVATETTAAEETTTVTETTAWLSEETQSANLSETEAPAEITIKINADGKTTNVVTVVEKDATNRTVAALLAANGITLGEDDLLTPALDVIINESTEITVRRVKYVERITVNPIPYETEYIESTLHTIGYSEIVTEGINGSEQVTTREKLVDGEVASSEVLGVDITNQPVTEVQVIGTALATPYSKREFDEIDLENGLPTDYEFVVSGKSCAYTAGPNAGTASGRELEIGTVAVDPNIIPYGSLLYIVTQDGSRVYGAAVAADTGYLTDVVVDLFMGLTSENYDDACNWGARNVDVYVINTGKY